MVQANARCDNISPRCEQKHLQSRKAACKYRGVQACQVVSQVTRSPAIKSRVRNTHLVAIPQRLCPLPLLYVHQGPVQVNGALRGGGRGITSHSVKSVLVMGPEGY